MKKFLKKVCLIIIILISVYIIYIIYLHTLYDYNFYSSLIEISIPMFAKMEEKDTHGGFHGDGEAFVKVYFSDKQVEKFIRKIEKNKNWSKLPMNEILQNCISNNITDESSVQIIENGYWFFIDRHSETTDKYNYNEIFNRASSNYSIAIFDIESNVLYIYSLDT